MITEPQKDPSMRHSTSSLKSSKNTCGRTHKKIPLLSRLHTSPCLSTVNQSRLELLNNQEMMWTDSRHLTIEPEKTLKKSLFQRIMGIGLGTLSQENLL